MCTHCYDGVPFRLEPYLCCLTCYNQDLKIDVNRGELSTFGILEDICCSTFFINICWHIISIYVLHHFHICLTSALYLFWQKANFWYSREMCCRSAFHILHQPTWKMHRSLKASDVFQKRNRLKFSLGITLIIFKTAESSWCFPNEGCCFSLGTTL